ncbi:unnamed protein product [Closterium sp. NIES-65]|nr:unnamed protein product [Closterium sp. NIES-65]
MESHLLAIAVSSRPMYLARTVPPRPGVVDAFSDWDSSLEDCFEQLFPSGTWEYDPARSRLARLQLHVAVRLGGFGIRAVTSLSPLSYACGWAQAVCDTVQLGVADEEAMFADYLRTVAGVDFLYPWFSKSLDQLLEGPGAGAWVSAVPAHADFTFTAAEWSIAAAMLLGLPIQQLHVAERCICGTVYKDPADPHHALRCKHQHGPSWVHYEVKFAMAKISKASGGVVTMKDDMLLPEKRVDIAVRRLMNGEAHALEISVADPLSLSPSLAHVILMRAASSMGGVDVDLVDREREDRVNEWGALWVEAPYLSDVWL